MRTASSKFCIASFLPHTETLLVLHRLLRPSPRCDDPSPFNILRIFSRQPQMGTIGRFLSSSVGRERPVIKCRLPDLQDTGQAPKPLHELFTTCSDPSPPIKHQRTTAIATANFPRFTWRGPFVVRGVRALSRQPFRRAHPYRTFSQSSRTNVVPRRI